MKVIGNILAGMISMIFSVVLFIMMLLIFISNIFSENYYKNILNDIDMSEIKLSDLGVSSLSEEFGEDASVEDVLVETLEEAGINENDARHIVNNEKVNEVVGEFLSDTMVYLTDNKQIPQLDYEDVEEIINSKEISQVLEDIPNDEEIKELVDELNNFIVETFEGGI